VAQHHIVVNLDKQEYIYPPSFSLGAELKRWQRYSGDATIPQAIYLLITASVARGGGDLGRTAVSGRWVGDRVVVIGDYTKDGDLPSYPEFGGLYVKATKEWLNISDKVVKAFSPLLDADLWAPRTFEALAEMPDDDDDGDYKIPFVFEVELNQSPAPSRARRPLAKVTETSFI